MAQKTRATLKEYFESGKIPTEGNFADLIDSTVNINDDEVHVRTVGQTTQEKYIGVGTSVPEEKLEVAGNVKAEEFKGKVSWNNIINLPNELIPGGVIMMWSGELDEFDKNGKGKSDSLLKEWALCNGKNGTPDLRGRFIVGWGKSSDGTTNYTSGQSGGEEMHQLKKEELPRHHHYARNTKDDSRHPDNNATMNITNSGMHSHSVPTVYRSNGKHIHIEHDPNAAKDSDKSDTRTWSSEHKHINDDFRGRVGNGAVDGLNDKPHENRPPYYTLVYIMKL